MMTHCRFTDFDITIHGQQAPYLVHATYHQHAAIGQFGGDAADQAWSTRLDHLAATRGLVGQRAIEEIGALLYAQLFRDDIRELWMRAHAALETSDAGLCLRLLVQPPAVAALPWEAMFDPDRNLLLAGSLQTPLVRVEKLLRNVGQMRALATALPLRLLIAAPEDPTGQIDAHAEMQQLLAMFGAQRETMLKIVAMQGRFSVVDLRQAITREQPDIVHLITHGQPEGIALWQHEMPVLTPASALRTALEGAESVKMVILNACSTAVGSLNRSLASVGAQLLQTGIPAVIAMQFDIEESAAGDFAHFFYQELFGGQCPGHVPRAVSFARSNLYALNPDSIGFTTPILWLNATSGAIFNANQLPIILTAPRTEPMPTVEDLLPLQEQRAQVEQWCTNVSPLATAALPVNLRPVQRLLQDALREINDLLVQMRHFDAEPPSARLLRQYTEKLEDAALRQRAAERFTAIIRTEQERRG
jgi:hypothetical protein